MPVLIQDESRKNTSKVLYIGHKQYLKLYMCSSAPVGVIAAISLPFAYEKLIRWGIGVKHDKEE